MLFAVLLMVIDARRSLIDPLLRFFIFHTAHSNSLMDSSSFERCVVVIIRDCWAIIFLHFCFLKMFTLFTFLASCPAPRHSCTTLRRLCTINYGVSLGSYVIHSESESVSRLV